MWSQDVIIIANNIPNKRFKVSFTVCISKRKTQYYSQIFASNTGLLECTLKICLASGRKHTCIAVGYLDFDVTEGGGGWRSKKGLRVEWKNSLDIISNFFETRGRYARLAQSLTHVWRRVTVKHLAPAGAGYVTWIFVSNKICCFASAIWRTSRRAYITTIARETTGSSSAIDFSIRQIKRT